MLRTHVSWVHSIIIIGVLWALGTTTQVSVWVTQSWVLDFVSSFCKSGQTTCFSCSALCRRGIWSLMSIHVRLETPIRCHSRPNTIMDQLTLLNAFYQKPIRTSNHWWSHARVSRLVIIYLDFSLRNTMSRWLKLLIVKLVIFRLVFANFHVAAILPSSRLLDEIIDLIFLILLINVLVKRDLTSVLHNGLNIFRKRLLWYLNRIFICFSYTRLLALVNFHRLLESALVCLKISYIWLNLFKQHKCQS